MEQNRLGSSVILPDFVLPTRVNQCWEYSGIDSLEHCLDPVHFKQYSWPITYNYNSRGFRDQEWPVSVEELKNSIWCVGDSFTVGLGSPLEHTWAYLLGKKTQARIINVSLDGASNNWISRKVVDILQQLSPHCIVIHWSYLHRREKDANQIWQDFYRDIKDPQWPLCNSIADIQQLPNNIKQEIDQWPRPTLSDEDLRIECRLDATDEDDLNNTIQCISAVNQASSHTKIIHSFIPKFCKKANNIYQYLDQNSLIYVPEFLKIDLARDGHHYDCLTSQQFVDQIVQIL